MVLETVMALWRGQGREIREVTRVETGAQERAVIWLL